MKDLKCLYAQLLTKYNLQNRDGSQDIFTMIKKLLSDFCNEHKNVAIYCNGRHTKRLMGDFIFEMKKCRYIIDKSSSSSNSGFCFILPEEISSSNIDGIIISSFEYRQEIKEYLSKNYPDIHYLDFYEELEKKGIVLNCEYYSVYHPYAKYIKINQLIINYLENEDENKIWEIIQELVSIKDFNTAKRWALKLTESKEFVKNLEEIIELQNKIYKSASRNNVIMLCIDGMRRKDFFDGMPKVSKWIEHNAFSYTNAYSTSTSTYESLIPTYSENNNMQTKYYDKNSISEKECPFVKEAIKQNREIYFYTDSVEYVVSDKIHYSNRFLTATEKIWDFTNDVINEKNGLFYIHILYESHFSFPNPYIEEPIVADGTSVFFDFLDVNGGKLKTDYKKQHDKTMQYLDDSLIDFFQNCACDMVVYADHGNYVLNREFKLEQMEEVRFGFSEELIRIPLVIKSCHQGIGKDNQIISLMNLNQIIISLLNHKKYDNDRKKYIKFQRSRMYNPDMRYIYEKCNMSFALKAFEGFILEEKYKLIISEDGETKLYSLDDIEIQDQCLIKQLINLIRNEITVTSF